MKTLQGPVICHPAARAKHAPVSILPINTFLRKHGLPRSGFWGSKGKCTVQVSARCLQPCGRTGGFVHCSFSSSSDGNGSVAGNFSENDGEYVNSSVNEAGFEAILGCYFVCIDHKHRLRHEPKKSRRTTIEEKTLLKRLGTTGDMAAAAAFLASEDTSYITGETLVVAGGVPSRI